MRATMGDGDAAAELAAGVPAPGRAGGAGRLAEPHEVTASTAATTARQAPAETMGVA